MSGDRIVLVGIAWTLVLLVLLVLREVLRSSERPTAARIVPVVNVLAGIMVVAFSAAAVLRLTLLVDPPDVSAQTSATPTASAIGAVSVTPPPLRTPTRSPTPTLSPTPTPTPTLSPTPTPSPTPTLPPTPPPSPSPSPAPSVDPDDPGATYGTLTLPTRYTEYTATGRRVTGFKKVKLDAPVVARGVGPRVYRLETLGDPSGRKLLVRILAGPYEGTLVSPDDPGVEFVPD